MKAPKRRIIKAWAVLAPKPAELAPYGNGTHFQYPIFHSKREAQAWKNEVKSDSGPIVRCTVELEAKHGSS